MNKIQITNDVDMINNKYDVLIKYCINVIPHYKVMMNSNKKLFNNEIEFHGLTKLICNKHGDLILGWEEQLGVELVEMQYHNNWVTYARRKR